MVTFRNIILELSRHQLIKKCRHQHNHHPSASPPRALCACRFVPILNYISFFSSRLTLLPQRITGQIHPLAPAKTFRANASTSDSFLTTKRDKRLMKHSSFLSQVSASAGVTKSSKNKRSRRPKNSLATTLDSLGDALPELDEDDEWHGIDGGNRGKVRLKGIKSRPGAMKKKEKVVRGEMERFGVSMARLGAMAEPEQKKETGAAQTTGGDTDMGGEKQGAAAQPQGSNRWAALRGYISSTMEQNPAFLKKQ